MNAKTEKIPFGVAFTPTFWGACAITGVGVLIASTVGSNALAVGSLIVGGFVLLINGRTTRQEAQ